MPLQSPPRLMTSERQAHIDDLLERITRLVRDRRLIEACDPTDPDVEETNAKIEQLHWQLARTVQANQRLGRATLSEHGYATATSWW
jgi:hypothetical protein